MIRKASPRSCGSIASKVACETWDCRNHNNDAELALLFVCSDDGIYHGFANGVVNWRLIFTRSGDYDVLGMNNAMTVCNLLKN